eukprot:TRINITY_DN3387_c0_g1_i1.p1 TRINITY_DN3387_c0_g1~~TRINITY_DN3387_c0_g1_i1.p1  ORF type:complete len:388 (+),score=39.29 TRINITY_DN3387_c0_g1_i1:81-1166(+)
MEPVRNTTVTTTTTTTTTKTVKKPRKDGKRSHSVPVVRCGSPILTESKEEFLRGIDRFAACYGGEEVMQWILRSSTKLQNGERILESFSPERRRKELTNVKAPDTRFDAWLAQHRDLVRPFKQSEPGDIYSPSLRSVSAITKREQSVSVSSSFSPVHRRHHRCPPSIVSTSVSQSVSQSPSKSHPMYTGQGGVAYQSMARQRWPLDQATPKKSSSHVQPTSLADAGIIDVNTTSYILSRSGDIHKPASSGESPVRIRSLSPPKVMGLAHGITSPPQLNVPPPTPVFLTPGRGRRSASTPPAGGGTFSSTPRHTHTPPFMTPTKSLDRCSCPSHTNSSRRVPKRLKYSYVWVPPGRSPARNR